jgi:hypothetical protein
MSYASPPAPPSSARRVFAKETLIRGAPARIECIAVAGQTFSIDNGPLTVVSLEDEWYDDVDDPDAVIEELRTQGDFKPDLLTFWQRIPEIAPRFQYPLEWEYIAVLPVVSYEHWWKNQIKSRVRNLVRHSEKQGVVVKRVPFDDRFVQGMTTIFNETRVRQGRPFWHYGKDFETVKRQFSRFLFREYTIGAYLGEEMVGFMMLGNAGRFGLTGQIISSIRHRDKAPNNALIAKGVEVCDAEKLGYLIYLLWSDDSLSEFKRRCGFQRVAVPRYYVPLRWKGRMALNIGAHRGLKAMLPRPLKKRLKGVRSRWLEWRAQRGY